jgi:4-amino-4-deoxy-L-arabinose transferase-like glycosyltransferase
VPSGSGASETFRITLMIVMAVTVIRIAWLAGKPFDLYPDEAQYWIWAQHPAWGYYSKPPMVAWMIWLTTTLFGEGDVQARLGSPVTYLVTSMVVYAIGSRLFSGRVGGWSAIAFATLPAVSISSAIISTDVPLLLFWALALYGFVRVREDGLSTRQTVFWWSFVGVAAGLGLLSKYAMGFWLLSGLIFLLGIKDERRHIKGFLAATVLALAIYAPNLAWNIAHGMASYKHTGANANLHGFAIHPTEFLTFLGSQFGVFGPIFLAALAYIVWRWRTVATDRRMLMLIGFSLPTLAIMLVESALSRAEPNWSAPTYVSATILVVAWLELRGRDLLVQGSVVLHLTLAVVAFGGPQALKAWGHPLPAKFDPLSRLRGWQILGQAASTLRLQAAALPLLGDDRETMCGLIYYMTPHPFDMKIWNPGHTVNNGFEMTQSLPDKPGGSYLWLTARPLDAQADVTSRFASHVQVGHITVPIAKGKSRQLTGIILKDFKGYGEPTPSKR